MLTMEVITDRNGISSIFDFSTNKVDIFQRPIMSDWDSNAHHVSHKMNNLYLLIVIVIVVTSSVATVPKIYRSYEVVKVEEPFKFPKDYVWRRFGEIVLDHGALYPYTAIRADEMTAKWNLGNSTELTRHLMEVHNKSGVQSPVFNSAAFLAMIRNKRIGVYGDSLGLQLFEGLHNNLTPHISAYRNFTGDVDPMSRDVHAVYSAKYNATIYYCDDPYAMLPGGDECIRRFYNSTDFFVFGVAAWCKPKFLNEHRSERVSYNESFTKSAIALGKFIKAARDKVHADQPNAKVIWRNQPHVGRLDEWKYLHNFTETDTIRHGNGLHWSNVSLGAHWPPVYNEVIAKQAAEFGDPVLDWYTLSLQYIEMFSHMVPRKSVHTDTLHYYADGLPRGAALMLQDALYDLTKE